MIIGITAVPDNPTRSDCDIPESKEEAQYTQIWWEGRGFTCNLFNCKHKWDREIKSRISVQCRLACSLDFGSLVFLLPNPTHVSSCVLISQCTTYIFIDYSCFSISVCLNYARECAVKIIILFLYFGISKVYCWYPMRGHTKIDFPHRSQTMNIIRQVGPTCNYPES